MLLTLLTGTALGAAGCDAGALATPAALGKLSASQLACAEDAVANGESTLDRKQWSNLLMQNAWARGDIAGYDRLATRHLLEIDPDDAEGIWRFAVYLGREPDRAHECLRWAELGLQRVETWSGDLRAHRTSTLSKLRVIAARQVWADAEAGWTASPTDAGRVLADGRKDDVRRFAREWAAALVAQGKHPQDAVELCVSAGGVREWCAGT